MLLEAPQFTRANPTCSEIGGRILSFALFQQNISLSNIQQWPGGCISSGEHTGTQKYAVKMGVPQDIH